MGRSRASSGCRSAAHVRLCGVRVQLRRRSGGAKAGVEESQGRVDSSAPRGVGADVSCEGLEGREGVLWLT